MTIRFDPRDMGEIRVFYKDRFPCRAISAELAGETVSFREIIRARNRRRQELRSILRDRRKAVDMLLQLKQGPVREKVHASTTVPPSLRSKPSPSSATETSSHAFVETLEHKRFVEFCDACRHFRYIGLCNGAPGIGKTLSAFRHSRGEMIVQFDRWTSESHDQRPIDTVFCTASVINTPSKIATEISLARERLLGIAMPPIWKEATEVLDAIRLVTKRSGGKS